MEAQSADVIKSLASLAGTRDFDFVLAWIKSSREERVLSMLVSSNPVLVHQHQGYVLALDDLMQAARTAPTAASRL